MRFLLQGRKLPVKGIQANVPLPKASKSDAAKAFGQQCSPQCGCILRFEASLDNNAQVIAATYHAKQVMCNSVPTTQNNQQEQKQLHQQKSNVQTHYSLQPALTMSRNPKPLLMDCTCPSLHRLAKQVVAHLPVQRNLRNQVEFTGVRSSLAFSHAVLRRFQLPTHKTRCLDLVEDALNALIKQCLPMPIPNSKLDHHSHANSNTKSTTASSSTTPTWSGRHPSDFTTLLNRQHQLVLEQAEEEEFVERFGRALLRVRKPRNVMMNHSPAAGSSLSSLELRSSLSALTLLDMMQQQDDEEEQNLYHFQHSASADLDDYNDEYQPLVPLPSLTNKRKLLDWETYVDGLHYRDENEATG
jgi:hypothetical protein